MERKLYGEYCGHAYVDMGLSVMWATCNVGASSPSDYGDYFPGGSWLDLDYDSYYFWGGTWRAPTKKEFQELLSRCTWRWTTQGDHNGYHVTGPNGNSIFLPAAGHRIGTLYSVGSAGEYRSSTPFDSNYNSMYSLYFSALTRYVYWDTTVIAQTVRRVFRMTMRARAEQ